ncbi:MAG: PD-(D/E)XK nuclease family protein [bacterium]|nr:PD-(D/E)XK nuclease family protein [bacterium]
MRAGGDIVTDSEAIDCACTTLTGEACLTCPDCGGEGVLPLPPSPPLVRASSLGMAQHCPGMPALGARVSRARQAWDRGGATEAMLGGTIAHAFLESWISLGPKVADRWLVDNAPEMKDELRKVRQWLLSEWFDPLSWDSRYTEVELASAGLGINGHADLIYMVRDEPGIAVVDYKYGPGQKYYLPPLEQDWQMMAYAVLASFVWGGPVTVLRVRLSDREVDVLELDEGQLAASRAVLEAIAEQVHDDPENRTPGAHCDSCFYRDACPERLTLIKPVESVLAIPHEIETLTTGQARSWALARRAIRERAAELDEALERHIRAGGIVEADGRALRLSEWSADKVINHRAALQEVIQLAGGHSEQALRTNKGGMDAALKAANVATETRNAMMARLRETGAIVSEPRSAMRWRRT